MVGVGLFARWTSEDYSMKRGDRAFKPHVGCIIFRPPWRSRMMRWMFQNVPRYSKPRAEANRWSHSTINVCNGLAVLVILQEFVHFCAQVEAGYDSKAILTVYHDGISRSKARCHRSGRRAELGSEVMSLIDRAHSDKSPREEYTSVSPNENEGNRLISHF